MLKNLNFMLKGNNPSVSSGAPVELGWAHAIEKHIEIDMYEDARHGRRRFKGQMRMPKEVRRNVLLHHGHTQKSIKRAAKDAKKNDEIIYDFYICAFAI